MNFDEIYVRLFKPILAYVRGRMNRPDAAEEVCARIWQKAWSKREQFDPQKGVVDQWIFGIARNEVNKYFGFWQWKRFFSLEEEQSYTAQEPTPLEQLQEQEKNQVLLRALQILNARERDLISFKFFADFNNRQIAHMTGMSESNVGTTLSRAIHKLRAYMEGL